MNLCVLVLAVGAMFVFGVGLAVIAAVVVGGRADDEMEEYMAKGWPKDGWDDKDPPTGI